MQKKTIGMLLAFSCYWIFTVNVCAQVAAEPLASDQSIPEHFKKLDANAVRSFSLGKTSQLTKGVSAAANFRFDFPLLASPLSIASDDMVRHANGNMSFSKQIQFDSTSRSIIYTEGDEVGIGEIRGGGQHLYFERYGSKLYVVDVGISGLLPALYDNDVVGQHTLPTRSMAQGKSAATMGAPVIVDLMLIYTPNIVAEFPGAMTEALLNQLVMKANQANVDSGIAMQLRLVHTQFVDYTTPSDIVAINDLAFAMENPTDEATDPSLRDVTALRNQFGADLIAMIRTHDLNEREVCGIARFPQAGSDTLINISNVGISGGSNCMDTFTHEIGHNFGAQHQRENDQPQGPVEFAGALVVDGKFNTLMSSIGTGDVNRNLGLNVFSNPGLQCGGVVCGDVVVADNARSMNSFAQTNADLRAEVSVEPVVPPDASAIDTDGDGSLDVNDVFPFDATESLDSDLDGVGDNADVFPTDLNESLDTDNDGIGDNADADDDNDGVPDTGDDLPFNADESVDSDSDGVGANSDELDDNFQDFSDFDRDGIGNKADPDDDNDGVPDFSEPSSLVAAEAWVASAGSDAILRFNASTGEFIDTLLNVEPGGLSFRSDMALSSSRQLFFIAFSDVLEYDPQIDAVRTAVDRGDIDSNFPGHITFRDPQTLFVGHGFGPGFIDMISLAETRNFSIFTGFDHSVIRDLEMLGTNRLLAVSRQNNQVLFLNLDDLRQDLALFISEGLDKPEHMAIDVNLNIYITNVGNGTVSQHTSAGQFVRTFISAGSGGLGTPGCITIGPDGNIYVCSTDTGQILKFDGDSGAFIEVFAQAGDGGLSQPVSLVFAGLPLDEFRLNGDHDTDGDGVNNNFEDFPQDATETTDTDGDGTGNNADTDDDEDGMPDTFEVDSNLDPLDPSDADQDTDNDGSTNLQEFLAGTDPNVADSTPVPPPAPPPAPTPIVSSGGGGGTMGFDLLILSFLGLFRLFLTRQLKPQHVFQ